MSSSRFKEIWLEEPTEQDRSQPCLLIPARPTSGLLEDLQVHLPHIAARVRKEHEGELDPARLQTLVSSTETRGFCALAIVQTAGKGWKRIHPALPDELVWPDDQKPGWLEARMGLLRYLSHHELLQVVQVVSAALSLGSGDAKNSAGPSATSGDGTAPASTASDASPASEPSEAATSPSA
jgi:hypothetical protein